MNKRHFPQPVFTIPLLHHHIQETIQAQYLQAEQFDAQRLTAKHIATQHRFCREQRKHAVQKTASCMPKHCFSPCHPVLLAKLKAVFHKEGDNTQILESLFCSPIQFHTRKQMPLPAFSHAQTEFRIYKICAFRPNFHDLALSACFSAIYIFLRCFMYLNVKLI